MRRYGVSSLKLSGGQQALLRATGMVGTRTAMVWNEGVSDESEFVGHEENGGGVTIYKPPPYLSDTRRGTKKQTKEKKKTKDERKERRGERRKSFPSFKRGEIERHRERERERELRLE